MEGAVKFSQRSKVSARGARRVPPSYPSDPVTHDMCPRYLFSVYKSNKAHIYGEILLLVGSKLTNKHR